MLAHSARRDEFVALLREQNVDALADALLVTSIIERAFRAHAQWTLTGA